jgi:hypothetical protein
MLVVFRGDVIPSLKIRGTKYRTMSSRGNVAEPPSVPSSVRVVDSLDESDLQGGGGGQETDFDMNLAHMMKMKVRIPFLCVVL